LRWHDLFIDFTSDKWAKWSRDHVSFTLKPGKSIRRELTRIARKELGTAAARLIDGHRSDDEIHESRKGVKKVEAVTRLLDELGAAPPRKVLKRLHGARRTLSQMRDARALIETYDRLRARFSHRIPGHTSAMIRSHFTRRRTALMGPAHTRSVEHCVGALRKIRRSVKHWPLKPINVSALPCLLRQSYRTARKKMVRAQGPARASDFHEWRKQVKNLWYQLRLVERLVAGMSRRIAEFGELETVLGEEHNLSVLRGRLHGDRGLRRLKAQTEEVAAMSMALEEELRRAALALGSRMLKMTPKEFEKDLEKRLRPNGARRRRRPSRSDLHVVV
jgi:CHAD domain-containing protein